MLRGVELQNITFRSRSSISASELHLTLPYERIISHPNVVDSIGTAERPPINTHTNVNATTFYLPIGMCQNMRYQAHGDSVLSTTACNTCFLQPCCLGRLLHRRLQCRQNTARTQVLSTVLLSGVRVYFTSKSTLTIHQLHHFCW